MPQRLYVIDQMISAKSIAARIEALAREIEAEYKGTDKLVVVGLLRGSFVFIADLVRELDLPVEVDFLEASSYGDATESSRRASSTSAASACGTSTRSNQGQVARARAWNNRSSAWAAGERPWQQAQPGRLGGGAQLGEEGFHGLQMA